MKTVLTGLLFFFYGHIDTDALEKELYAKSLAAFLSVLTTSFSLFAAWALSLMIDIEILLYVMFGLFVCYYFLFLKLLSNLKEELIRRIKETSMNAENGFTRLFLLALTRCAN